MASESSSAARRFQDALYESLAGGEPAVRDAGPLVLLSRLTESGARSAAGNAAAAAAIESLSAVARADQLEEAMAAAEARFETPERFREAIYFARCLARDADQSLRLLEERGYLEAATVPAALADLLTDRAAVLDATTFAALWREPARLEWMLNAAAIWRREYVAAYLSQHAAYHGALGAIAEAMDGLLPQVGALERLNGLRRLGPPLAAAALAQFHELERLFACPREGPALSAALAASPVCDCGFRLGDRPPAAEARRARQAIDRGLAGQQARLARRVVSRLLSRPTQTGEERLARFIEVVQASDLSGLALVLDDELVEFLRRLLEEPDEHDLLDRVARAFPEVTAANLEAAVGEFRRLLEAELTRAGRARLSGPSTELGTGPSTELRTGRDEA